MKVYYLLFVFKQSFQNNFRFVVFIMYNLITWISFCKTIVNRRDVYSFNFWKILLGGLGWSSLTVIKYFITFYNNLLLFIHGQGARHTYAQMAGRNVANPTAMILAGVDMLEHMK